jgi:hypothetical protein
MNLGSMDGVIKLEKAPGGHLMPVVVAVNVPQLLGEVLRGIVIIPALLPQMLLASVRCGPGILLGFFLRPIWRGT